MKRLLIILSVLLMVSACTDSPNAVQDEQIEQTAYETIAIDEIVDYVADGYIVVDVREIDEYETGHIPDAINAPLSALENGDYSPLNKNEQYIIICRSGNRSQTASNMLTSEGFDVVNVSEGMSSWAGDVEY